MKGKVKVLKGLKGLKKLDYEGCGGFRASHYLLFYTLLLFFYFFCHFARKKLCETLHKIHNFGITGT